MRDMLRVDPDVMTIGDFNLGVEDARAPADRLSMRLLEVQYTPPPNMAELPPIGPKFGCPSADSTRRPTGAKALRCSERHAVEIAPARPDEAHFRSDPVGRLPSSHLHALGHL